MASTKRFSLFFAFFFATAACGGTKQEAKAPETPEEPTLEIGSQAPDLALSTLNGQGKISKDSLAGKVVLVDFWATWCKPCEQSFPHLQEIAKKYDGKVVVIGISADDDKANVAEWAQKHGATFPIGWDQGHNLAKAWNVSKMPTTYVIDPQNRIRYVHNGFHDSDIGDLNEELAKLSDDKPQQIQVASNDSGSDVTPPMGKGAPAAPAATDTATADAAPAKATKAGKKAANPKKGSKKTASKKKKADS